VKNSGFLGIWCCIIGERLLAMQRNIRVKWNRNNAKLDTWQGYKQARSDHSVTGQNSGWADGGDVLGTGYECVKNACITTKHHFQHVPLFRKVLRIYVFSLLGVWCCMFGLVRAHSTFYRVQVTWAKFGLPVCNMNFSTQNGKWITVYITLCMILNVCISIMFNKKNTQWRKKNEFFQIIVTFFIFNIKKLC